MYYFMDSGPRFTGLVWLNAGGIVRGRISFRFWISCLFPEIFAIKLGSCVKSAEILHVFGPPNFLEEGPPEFLDMHYKDVAYLDHMAKFRDDRPREIGDPMAD